MESPVRIKTGVYILFGIILLVHGNHSFPKDGLQKNSLEDVSVEGDQLPEESSATAAKAISNETTSRFQPRNNTWLYQRRNMTNLMPNLTTTMKSNVPAETTANYGNKITFRGSVRYLATRPPPFKPKTVNLKKNLTKSDTSSEEKTTKVPISKLSFSTYRRRNSTAPKNIASEPSSIANTTSLPEKAESTDKATQITSPNEFTTTTPRYNNKVNRSESGKSFEIDFDVDKYTSAEFHDINNVYSQPISPEVASFIVPDNVSDYYVNVGSAPYTQYDYRSRPSEEMTTPNSDIFDKHFKEVSESIKQNLAESELSEDEINTEEQFDDAPTSTMAIEDLIAKSKKNNATLMFQNTKELSFIQDSKDSQSRMGEYTDANGTKLYYEAASLSTEHYDIVSTLKPMAKNNDNSEDNGPTTISPMASNEVLNRSFKPNVIRRTDHFKNNNATRKEFLTTIRMRTHTTPKPKMRISLRNSTEANKYSKDSFATTRPTPYYIRVNHSRRRNATASTAPSKIDPNFQLDNSPTRISDTDNSIPLLNKRGSPLLQTEKNSTKNNVDSQLSLPPTATAWALVSMKNTRINGSLTNGPALTKSGEDLQKLEKIQDTPKYQKIPTFTSPMNTDDVTDDEDSYEDGDDQDVATSASRRNYTMVIRPTTSNFPKKEEDRQKGEEPQESNVAFESITKFSDSVTTPLYDTSDYTTTDFNTEDGTTDNNMFDPMSGDIEVYSASSSKKSEYTSVDDERFITEDEAISETTTENYFSVSTASTKQPITASSNISMIDMLPSDSVSKTTTDIYTTISDSKITTTMDPTTTFEPTTVTERSKTKINEINENNLTTESVFGTTKNLNLDSSTMVTENRPHDIDAASTVYYTPQNKVEISTAAFTTENHITSTATNKPTLRPTLPFTLEDLDSREGKQNNDNVVTDEWIEAPDPTIKQMDSNEIPNTISVPQSNPDIDPTDLANDFNVKTDATTVTPFPTVISNVEIIEMVTEREPNENVDTTVLSIGDTKYESSVDDSGAVAAITISVIGVIALILIVGLLIVIRGRRRSGGYGQRCTPVSLDSYSLDNVSVSGSTRRKNRGPSKRSYGNPAYDESGATSHPMQFAALANFALDQDSIVNEFNEIPTITAKADEVPAGCESKNRYSNVIPLPETRVILKTLSGDETSDYINANYVRGPKNMKNYYIACQAPLASTVSDFWRMIWEQNSRVILMLTELMENGTEKCFEYLPPSEVSDSRRSFGDYQVVLKKREVRDKYVISTLQLKSLSNKVWREITHIWYFWPAKGVPDECNSIIAFLIEARSYLKASQSAKEYDQEESVATQNGSAAAIDQDDNSNEENDVHVYNVQKSEQQIKNGSTKNFNDTEGRKKSGPLIIHCSPGTGRTGSVIACDIGIRDFEMSRTVDVPKTVYRIRRDRANAVQTKDQYIFIYKVLSEYATKLTGGILDSI